MNTLARCELPGWRMRHEPFVADETAVELPCDADGRVEIDALDETGREAYFFARHVRRRRFATRVLPPIPE